MGLRDKLINEENKRLFTISDADYYEDKNFYAEFQVHDPIRGKYVITKNDFGGETKVLDILEDEEKAIKFAYTKAKEYVKENLGFGCKYEDKTSFKGLDLDSD